MLIRAASEKSRRQSLASPTGCVEGQSGRRDDDAGCAQQQLLSASTVAVAAEPLLLPLPVALMSLPSLFTFRILPVAA